VGFVCTHGVIGHKGTVKALLKGHRVLNATRGDVAWLAVFRSMSYVSREWRAWNHPLETVH
jgi:hypothetical protein